MNFGGCLTSERTAPAGASFLDSEAPSEIHCVIYSATRSSEKSAHWQLAVTPKDTVAGNFVPKLDFIRYFLMKHALFVELDYRSPADGVAPR